MSVHGATTGTSPQGYVPPTSTTGGPPSHGHSTDLCWHCLPLGASGPLAGYVHSGLEHSGWDCSNNFAGPGPQCLTEVCNPNHWPASETCSMTETVWHENPDIAVGDRLYRTSNQSWTGGNFAAKLLTEYYAGCVMTAGSPVGMWFIDLVGQKIIKVKCTEDPCIDNYTGNPCWPPCEGNDEQPYMVMVEAVYTFTELCGGTPPPASPSTSTSFPPSATFDCVNGVCVDPGDGTGFYSTWNLCLLQCNVTTPAPCPNPRLLQKCCGDNDGDGVDDFCKNCNPCDDCPPPTSTTDTTPPSLPCHLPAVGIEVRRCSQGYVQTYGITNLGGCAWDHVVINCPVLDPTAADLGLTGKIINTNAGCLYIESAQVVPVMTNACLGVALSVNVGPNGTGLYDLEVCPTNSTGPGCCFDCQNNTNDLPCPTFSCVSGACVDPGDGSGVYSSLANCQAACVPLASWNCVSGTCVDPGNGTGTYSLLASCQAVCASPPLWYCVVTSSTFGDQWSCQYVPSGGTPYGTVYGSYAVQSDCLANCPPSTPPSWNCVSGTCVDPGNGTGAYSLLATCQAACAGTGGTPCQQCGCGASAYNVNCGQYNGGVSCYCDSLCCGYGDCCPDACSTCGGAMCCGGTGTTAGSSTTPQGQPASYDCDDGTCSDPGDGTGAYSTEADCLAACSTSGSDPVMYGCKCSDPNAEEWPYLCAVGNHVYGIHAHPTEGSPVVWSIIQFNGDCLRILGGDGTVPPLNNGQWDGSYYSDCGSTSSCSQISAANIDEQAPPQNDEQSGLACDSILGIGVSYCSGGHISCGSGPYSFVLENAPSPSLVDYSNKAISIIYGGQSWCFEIDSGFGANSADAHSLSSSGIPSGACIAVFDAIYNNCDDCNSEAAGQGCS